MTASSFDYSIVIPVYQNEGCLVPMMRALADHVIARQIQRRGQIIFVEDGSRDASFTELQQIQRDFSDIAITIIRLTRNFGQAMAQLAGYHHAQGRCVLTISASGQDPPELINDMLRGFFEEDYEVVVCTRPARDDSGYGTLTSRFHDFLMRKLAFENTPPGGFDCYLLGRRALAVLVRNAQSHPSFQTLILWMGFRTKFIPHPRRGQLRGVSAFSFSTKVRSFFDIIFAYSFAPIRAVALLGCGLAVAGFAYAAVIAIGFFFWGHPVRGWSPLMIVILLIGGFQMIMLGIIGEYLWRVFAQVGQRDMYVIDAIEGPANQPAIDFGRSESEER